jgi:hypothetical protein
MGRLGRAKGGGSPGRSGPAQRPGSAVLIKGRKIERVLIFEFK